MKKVFRRVASLALMAVFCATPVLSDAEVNRAAAQNDGSSSLFTDVTGQVDMTDVALKNLSSSVIENTKSYTTHTVIVTFDGDTLVDAANGADVSEYAVSSAGERKAKNIKKAQDKFLKQLSKKGISYKLVNRYNTVSNAIALQLNTKYVSEIKAMSGVSSVCLSETYAVPMTVESASYAVADSAEGTGTRSATINETSVYKTGVYDSSEAMEMGYTGDGSVVAIIDTGLDYTHNAFIWSEEHSALYPMENAAFSMSYVEEALSSKAFKAAEKSALSGEKLSAHDVYISQKVPFAYDYADNDADVYPSYSNHGTHVAGIVGGYDPDGYTDKDGNHISDPFIGVAPESQLVICKVFSDDMDDSDVGGADTEDILAALEDCVLLGVDVINMSLGTSCGFSTTTDGDDEGELLNAVYSSVRDAGISLVCAASNDYSSSYGGNFGTNLASNPDSGTVGSPSVFSAALSVASISGQKSPYMIANGETTVFYEDSSDENNQYFKFIEQMLGDEQSMDIEYVSIPGVGSVSDYSSAIRQKFQEKPRLALVKRGTTSFKDKVEIAKSMGAVGIIVYNNVAGSIRMSLGEVNDPIPSASITLTAGKELADYAAKHNRVGTLHLDKDLLAGPFMSDFSSWGCTPDLKLKPEVTAHGGEITSTVAGGYDEMSGTSMASPNMAGVVSIIRSYLKETQPSLTTNELTQRINQLVMSTATIVYDREGLPYSPRKQGAGLGSLINAINSKAYLFTDDESIDYRPTVNLGDDKNKNGEYVVEFKAANFGSSALNFNVVPTFITEQLSSDGFAVAEQAYILDDITPTWTVTGGTKNADGSLTIGANSVATIKVTLKLSEAEKEYIDETFVNGMFVEGFISLESLADDQCDLTLPFLGFYGDWSAAPMLDCDAYEVDASLQDSSVDDEDKLNASVWATQPYTMYYGEEYSMPMGSFAYAQDENADRVYTVEEHNAISCYNDYYGENDGSNYLTAWQFRGLYVGLLRGARTVTYSLKNAYTGEVLYTATSNRIGKAYTSGNSTGTPAFVKYELNPLDCGLVSNGKYTMDFEFFLDYDNGENSVKNTYSYSFYADYEAPSLQNVRVRYYDYKDGNKEKQKIYLDLDVFDNHYAQSVLLCYYANGVLNQATDYVTPIYNSVKNGVNTVSIDITDIYEDYKDKLYVQLDDYALNHSVYYLDLSSQNQDVAPDTFELSSGEESVSVDIYGTHKVALSYSGSANLSNFSWSSANQSIADVKNGEIVGLKAGKTYVTVTNGKGVYRTIEVTVSDTVNKLSVPSLSFGTIIDSEESLVRASGSISVYPDQDVTLSVETDPWYYPRENLVLHWESMNADVADVDENGKLELKKEGIANIKATLVDSNNNLTAYSAVVMVNVLDPFEVTSFTLKEYHGKDKIVEIPTDKSIMYIGEDAFENNDTMEEVIIPKSVINIGEGAFNNCTALKRVYFVSKDALPIADADVKLIYRDAFKNCTALETVDLTNVKVVTLGVNAFAGCSSLTEIKKMQAIGTAFTSAFEGCSSLASIDLTGMHVAGTNVFKDCVSLSEVKTGRYTAIGESMFKNCVSLKEIVLKNTSIGANAFVGCSALKNVTIDQAEENYVIGAQAFMDSGLEKIDFRSTKVRKVGDRAFANTALTAFEMPEGLEEWGENVFVGTNGLKTIELSENISLEALKLFGSLFSSFDVVVTGSSQYVLENGVLYTADKGVLLAVIGDTNSVEIPDSVHTVYDYAFEKSNVSKLIIPNGVRTIGKGAFRYSNLSEISFESGSEIQAIEEETFRGCRLVSVNLPESVKSIGDYAFAETLLESIEIKDGVKEIGVGAFQSCKFLGSVTISASVESIGSYAFRDCGALKNVEIPSVKTMGSGVFADDYSLENVVFGDAAETMGEYTFWGANALQSVTLGSGITSIGDYAFSHVTWGGSSYVTSGCSALSVVNASAVTNVGAYAFANCGKLQSIDLTKVETIGEFAFYNCNKLTELTLSSAKSIGNAAFAADNGGATSISLPVAEKIGVSAFQGTKITEIVLPSTLKSIGYGAFAYTYNLTGFTVENGNEIYFAEDGVLYANSVSGGYQLIAYPAARNTTSDTYEVKTGTVRIDDFAFAGLKFAYGEEDENTHVTKVTFPYSLLSIGDSAFLYSDITEYTFECINAPVLETKHKQEVEDILTDHVDAESPMTSPAINGYYYTNFNTYFVYYIDMVGETSDLVLNYPSNGIGYDSFVYSRYFGVKNKIGERLDDETRAFIELVDGFASESDLEKWAAAAAAGDVTTYYDDVESFAANVKEARRLYDNTKEAQFDFIPDGYAEKLSETENALRDVKKAYGITVTVARLKVEGDYKKNYVEGETFDMTGLVVVIVYDDNSTEIADANNLTLVTTAVLTQYHNMVQIKYNDGKGTVKSVYAQITVTPSGESTENGSNGSNDDVQEEKSGCSSTIATGIAAICLVLATAVVFTKKKFDGESK